MSKIKYEYDRYETFDRDEVARFIENHTTDIERLAGEAVSALESFGSDTPEFDTHFLHASNWGGYGQILSNENVELSLPLGEVGRRSWIKYAVVPIHIILKKHLPVQFVAYAEYRTHKSKALMFDMSAASMYQGGAKFMGRPFNPPGSPIEYFYSLADMYTQALEINEVALSTLKTTGKISEYIATFVREQSLPYGAIKFERIVSNAMCEKCGRWIPHHSLSRHKSSRTCQAESTSKDVREAGYVNITHIRGIGRVLKADVGVVARPKSIEYWAPDWVAAAIKKYNDGGGFAGMSLDEYLDKMRPADAEQMQLPNDEYDGNSEE